MTNVIVRGWTARLYPTRAQAIRLNQWAGSLRFLWNHLLEREQLEYAATGRFLWRKELQPMAVGLKRAEDTTFLADLPAHALLDIVARLDGALRRMLSERRAGRRCGFPKPKKKFVREPSIYCVGQGTQIGPNAVRVPKLGRIRLRGGDVPQGRLLSARIRRDGEHWVLSAQFECVRPEPLAPSEVVLGIDLGVAILATIFDGQAFEEIPAPKPLRRALKRLRRTQRALSRRTPGSARGRAAVRRVQAIHRRVRHVRGNLLHQLSHRLTAKAGVLKVETLNVRGMVRNRHLALSVTDAGMGRLLSLIAHKADWRGRHVIRVDPWFPGSQICCCCGARHPEMKNLSRRTLICGCGNRLERDRNAAVNHYSYPEEPGKRGSRAPTRGERGEQPFGAIRTAVPLEEP